MKNISFDQLTEFKGGFTKDYWISFCKTLYWGGIAGIVIASLPLSVFVTAAATGASTAAALGSVVSSTCHPK